MKIKSLDDLDFQGKRVLTRVDFNVPMEFGEITDDLRIKEAIPTIQKIREKGGIPILISHLGRPKGKVRDNLRVNPVSDRLAKLIETKVTKFDEVASDAVEAGTRELKPGDVAMLENVRFEHGEEKNDPEFAARLAQLCDAYVNDAFGTAHRAHASTVGVVSHMKGQAAAGLLMLKEVETFHRLLNAPEHPFVAILGGAKVSDKIPVLKNLVEKVDVVLIGGAMAYTLLLADGRTIGSSRIERDILDVSREILSLARSRDVKLLLPVDHEVAETFDQRADSKTVEGDIPDGWMGLDIGPKTVELFSEEIGQAATVLWNGPMGVFEWSAFAGGTWSVGEAIAAACAKGAMAVVGGGDSAAAAAKFDLTERFSHVSTGGGASLEMLEGKVLPGIQALEDAAS